MSPSPVGHNQLKASFTASFLFLSQVWFPSRFSGTSPLSTLLGLGGLCGGLPLGQVQVGSQAWLLSDTPTESEGKDRVLKAGVDFAQARSPGGCGLPRGRRREAGLQRHAMRTAEEEGAQSVCTPRVTGNCLLASGGFLSPRVLGSTTASRSQDVQGRLHTPAPSYCGWFDSPRPLAGGLSLDPEWLLSMATGSMSLEGQGRSLSRSAQAPEQQMPQGTGREGGGSAPGHTS